MNKNCKMCKKLFKASNKYRFYCSKKCSGEYNKGKVICNYCSNEFSRRNNSSKFCTRECFFSWRKNQNNSPTKKKCCGCKEIKSIVLFSLAHTRKNGRQTLCKECKKKINRTYYLNNK